MKKEIAIYFKSKLQDLIFVWNRTRKEIGDEDNGRSIGDMRF